MAKILTINTINKNIELFLQEDKKIIDSIIITEKNQQSELLIINIENILKQNNLDYNNVDCFSVINGPGSFIGLKISISAIKAIKCVLRNKNIIENNVFEILAFEEKYDFIILDADINGYYIADTKKNYFYLKKDELYCIIKKEHKIITNSKNLLDFLKSNNIFYKYTEQKYIVKINFYKYENKIFNNDDIKALYIREPKINKRNE